MRRSKRHFFSSFYAKTRFKNVQLVINYNFIIPISNKNSRIMLKMNKIILKEKIRKIQIKSYEIIIFVNLVRLICIHIILSRFNLN